MSTTAPTPNLSIRAENRILGENGKKRCSICLEIKEFTCFRVQKRGLFGFMASCSDCENTRYKQWYKTNPEPQRIASRKYNAAHRKQIRDRKRIRYQEDKVSNPEKFTNTQRYQNAYHRMQRVIEFAQTSPVNKKKGFQLACTDDLKFRAVVPGMSLEGTEKIIARFEYNPSLQRWFVYHAVLVSSLNAEQIRFAELLVKRNKRVKDRR